MQSIRTPSYDVFIENGLVGRLGDRIPPARMPRRALLVADETVARRYGARAKRSLEAVGIQVHTLPLKAGGYCQTLNALKEIAAKLNELNMGAEDALVPMGGGVLCDMGGFAAWNHKQMIRLIQVPTTLIGMTDWAIQGKTAIEHKVGSRMIGSFFPPSLILIDPQTSFTQPTREFDSGMAEVIKCACAADASLFHMLESLTGRAAVEARLEEISWRCLCIKQSLQGREQAKMMLGHHLGHVIETAQRYRGLLHGEAIGVGMLMTSRLGEALGMTVKGTTERIESCLTRYSLPISTFADETAFMACLRTMPRFEAVLPERVGWSILRQLDNTFLLNAWQHSHRANIRSM